MENGGRRPGAGRKSKAEELKLAETIDNALGEKWVDDLLKEIYSKAKKGSFLHAQLLLAYKYGKPPEKMEHSGSVSGNWDITLNLDANKLRAAVGAGIPEKDN